jgi:hypothetical protein
VNFFTSIFDIVMRVKTDEFFYVLTFFLVVISALAPVFYYGGKQQPVTGDLTRIGYYSENDFGWNNEQIFFPEPLFEVGDEDEEFDIVVIGDSFSTHPNESWVNTLTAQTGFKIGVFEYDADFDSIVNPKNHAPPRILIMQAVERTLFHRFGNDSVCENRDDKIPQAGSTAAHLIVNSPLTLGPLPLFREKGQQGVFIDIGYEFKKIIKTKSPKVRRLSLVRSDLFSNSISSEILLYYTDFQKQDWYEVYWKHMACGVSNRRIATEANGLT